VSDLWAAIDVGSNSTLLLIARIKSAAATHRVLLEPLLEQSVTTRLGAGLGQTGLISDQAADLTIATVSSFCQLCRDYAVPEEHVVIVGTEALRRAKNSRGFVTALFQVTKIELKILSAIEEAEMTWLGAQAGLSAPQFPHLFFDIGGGSTELIFQRTTNAPLIPRSLPLGCVRLCETFDIINGVIQPRLEQVHQSIREILTVAAAKMHRGHIATAVGIGGTMTTLGAMSLALTDYDARQIQGLEISATQIRNLFDHLNGLTPDQRRNMAGLPHSRADIIGAGLAICLGIINCWQLNSVTISCWGLRHGVLLSC